VEECYRPCCLFFRGRWVAQVCEFFAWVADVACFSGGAEWPNFECFAWVAIRTGTRGRHIFASFPPFSRLSLDWRDRLDSASLFMDIGFSGSFESIPISDPISLSDFWIVYVDLKSQIPSSDSIDSKISIPSLCCPIQSGTHEIVPFSTLRKTSNTRNSSENSQTWAIQRPLKNQATSATQAEPTEMSHSALLKNHTTQQTKRYSLRWAT